MFQGIFTYQTIVKADVYDVWSFFQNLNMLERLTTFPKVQVLPSERESFIKLRIQAGILTFYWYANIIESKEPIYFIDAGQSLPFPFIDWIHKHLFTQWGCLTGITDYVYFKSYVPSWMVKTGLKQMFRSREKALKQFFS
ncbi:ligand-binding SRPBCC domain-containing protein [Salibacterium salarium]|uniref:hypothetical protein n=1 Tax=Salibacterium salarium TaxID=284579 RepID=UPI00277ED0A0|nr:hypothetical protein [Salibacterium salarium]MDQ0299007.1 ligand-binding SRPBCC domain-containing protein [Salibacterium salarium]